MDQTEEQFTSHDSHPLELLCLSRQSYNLHPLAPSPPCSLANIYVSGNISRAKLVASGASLAYLNTSAPGASVSVRTEGISTAVVIGGTGGYLCAAAGGCVQ